MSTVEQERARLAAIVQRVADDLGFRLGDVHDKCYACGVIHAAFENLAAGIMNAHDDGTPPEDHP